MFLIFHVHEARVLALGLLAMMALERTTRPKGDRPLFWGWVFLGIVFFSSFRALLVHQGETVLFSIPRSFPWVGGIVTQEGLMESWTIGLQVSLVVLWSLMSLRNLPAEEWMLVFPRRLRSLSVFLMVGIKTIPHLRETFEETRTIYRARGHVLSGMASYVPMVSSWVQRSVEKGLAFAEVLEIRGYRLDPPMQPTDGRGRSRWKAWMQIVVLALLVFAVSSLALWMKLIAWYLVSLWMFLGSPDD